MKALLKTFGATAAVLGASAGSALAQTYSGGTCSIFTLWNCFGSGSGSGGSTGSASVPEIDASAGLLAVAAVAAAMLLVWERRRRAR
ncbi:hypothetical protein GCM10011452_20730 [Gemmobacter lanyuensis]|uniref:VPEID-CTERM sorting domain-containing protein n=1 Tax=Gemmobacter lanyuensis TaxID=1054497 RepID=A0A918IWS9_9RHOB|nr:VPEID-CTERM sorting domain-containing protein [Gemmobacter lanyuensis]GGW32005.1 hypothetical protein GCM10011452_20730 [Gemmobacter lanyuensis]